MPEREQLKTLLPIIAAFFGKEGRPLPWRADRDPYHVWLSEIMLQQTRVEAVIPYYERFLSLFPSVRHLAEAEDELLYKAWEGLGYYSRARNLKKAALAVKEAGAFPTTYEGLLALKGVGEYTAGAIASICYGHPVPAVDGNVLRIFARLYAVNEPITPSFKRRATEALAAVYPAGEDAGRVTQGFMEIGQRFCLPNGAPKCDACPLRPYCRVGKEGGYERIPQRAVKKARKIEKRTVLLLLSEEKDGPRFALSKRPDEGLLAGLWEFPSVEGHLSDTEAFSAARRMGFTPLGAVASVSATHIFTHVEWHMESYLIPIAPPTPEGFVLASSAEMTERFPIASAFRAFKALASETEKT